MLGRQDISEDNGCLVIVPQISRRRDFHCGILHGPRRYDLPRGIQVQHNFIYGFDIGFCYFHIVFRGWSKCTIKRRTVRSAIRNRFATMAAIEHALQRPGGELLRNTLHFGGILRDEG